MPKLTEHPPLPLIEVSGSNAECGSTAGALSTDRIAHFLATYKRTFELCDISWPEAIKEASTHQSVIKELHHNYWKS